MPNYLIHTMPKRKWYVENYLIPSMLEQGIKKDSITIYNDDNKAGNLKTCMTAFFIFKKYTHISPIVLEI